ncbi:putative endonuclease [Pseudarcicella hirudinis]|uniref:UPF0102 protein SAMN04515674_112148 n=1 Tax=Pseudarcicella hirudinis TaxID=1079859 RepID=A0A1I5WSH5_9BACT|nr:YraN family protein [Pseudarcicella hirudinis]SFQ22561.1 putative endonuclease [Pseudarcicella hirudinis]
MPKHLDTGKLGEDLAERFLLEKGYQIIKRNYFYEKAEIDLITLKDKFLVFVEVKSLHNTSFGMPEDSVNKRKIQLILKAAENYIFENDWKGEIRFDIISIIFKKGDFEIMHFEDAFY